MSLLPMAPGGQWFQPPVTGGVPVYVPLKQLEAHRKRLVAEDGWMPIPDPRKEEDQATTPVIPVEVAMQARIDQLEAMLQQLLAKSAEDAHVPLPKEAEGYRKPNEAMQAQFIKEAAETNDAAREAFGIPPKNTRGRSKEG